MENVKNPVMCRAIEPLIAVSETRSIPLGPILDGLPYELEYLKNPKNRIRFGDFALLCQRWEDALGGRQNFIDTVLKKDEANNNPFLSILRFARFVADPMVLYRIWERFAGPAMFPCVKSTLKTLGPRTIEIHVMTPKEDAHCENMFWVTEELLRTLPETIGAPAANISLKVTPHHGTYLVNVPVSRSIWARFTRLFRVARSSAWLEEELTLQNDIMLESVSELKQTYTELEDKSARLVESQKRFQLAVSGARDGIWDWDLNSDQIYFSQRWYEICGYDAQYHILDSKVDWLERVHPDDLAGVEKAIDDHIEGKSPSLDQQYRIVLPNTQTRWVHVKGVAVRNANGDAERMAGSLSDITELIQTLHTLDVTERSYEAVIENSPDATFFYSDDGILACNKSMEKFVGYSEEELVGKPILKISDHHTMFYPPDISELRGAYVVEFINKSGEKVFGEVSAIRVVYDGGYSFCALVRDITEKRTILKRAKEMDRMIAVGTMASGVAHEINNPMAYIHSNTEFVRDELKALTRRIQSGENVPGDDLEHVLMDVNAAVADVIEGAVRVRDIVRDLKSYSYSAEKERPLPVEVVPIIESAINMAAHETTPRCKVITRFQRTPLVSFNETRLSQIVLNLIINAAHSIEPGAPGENEIRITTHCNARHVYIEISDTGSGIPEQLHDKIFNPFFTTKPAGQGTGLGLSICYNIVRRFGGNLEFDTEVGRGTTFRITLDRYEESIAWESSEKEISETLPDHHVLVIDDDDKIGVMMKRVLSANYHVTFVRDSTQTFNVLEDLGDVDLIISDAMMPDLSGYDILDQLEAVNPQMLHRFILMTGGRLETHRFNKFQEKYAVPVVFKPFDIDELKTVIINHLPMPLAKGAE